MRFVARQNSRHGRLIAAVNALNVRYGFGIACTIILSLVNFVLKDNEVWVICSLLVVPVKRQGLLR